MAMDRRVLAVLAVLAALLLGAALRHGDGPPDAGVAAPPAGAGAGARVAAATPTDDGNAEAARQAARIAALRGAVAALHDYLRLLHEDRARADQAWSGGRAGGGEADLRMLDAVARLRIETGTPTALDRLDPTAAVEIPVALRAAVPGGTRAYEGVYRLRRRVAGDGWEITSAAIDASRAGR
jgi:hypothetical protein